MFVGNNSTLRVSDTSFSSTASQSFGGGIYLESSTATIASTNFTRTRALKEGDVIKFAGDAVLTMWSSSHEENKTDGSNILVLLTKAGVQWASLSASVDQP